MIRIPFCDWSPTDHRSFAVSSIIIYEVRLLRFISNNIIGHFYIYILDLTGSLLVIILEER